MSLPSFNFNALALLIFGLGMVGAGIGLMLAAGLAWWCRNRTRRTRRDSAPL